MSKLSIEQEVIKGLTEEEWIALQKLAEEVYGIPR